MRYRLTVAAMLGAAAMLYVASASAQLNNQPVSAGGGFGMSMAARQAIMNQQLSGATPGNVVIGPDGTLLNVTRDANGLAVVSTQGGWIIPQYRGRNHALGGLDVDPNDGYYGLGGSHDSINSWTSQVTELGGPHN